MRVCPWITGIMIGEGEETFQELVDYYKGGDSKEEIGDSIVMAMYVFPYFHGVGMAAVKCPVHKFRTWAGWKKS